MKIRFTIRTCLLIVTVFCLILTFLYPPVKSTVVIELNSASTNRVKNTIANAIANWYDKSPTRDIESYRRSTFASITESNQLRIEVSGAPFQTKTVEAISCDLADYLAETYSDRRAMEETLSELEHFMERSKEANPEVRVKLSESLQQIRKMLQTHSDPIAGSAETKRAMSISTIAR